MGRGNRRARKLILSSRKSSAGHQTDTTLCRNLLYNRGSMMTHPINTEELNAQAEIAAAEKLLGIAQSGARAPSGRDDGCSRRAGTRFPQAPASEGANSHSTTLDESDDGVEAL